MPVPDDSSRGVAARRDDGAIVYLSSYLPGLSMTFVYRELLGLRARGRRIVPVSLHAPQLIAGDSKLDSLAGEALRGYGPATFATLPLALVWRAPLVVRAAVDAALADHGTLTGRLKHLIQAAIGIGLGFRLRHRGIVHVHAHMANPPAMVGLYLARALGAHFSFTGHAVDIFVQREALAFKLGNADFVSCISHWHRDFYSDVLPAAPRDRPVIRCSVSLPEVPGAMSDEVVVVARLIAKKGIDLLIRAFARAELAGWTLRILGDGPERADLAALAASLDLADRVRFEGARPHAECLAAIAGCGIFALPSRTASSGDKDGIPVVLMEAMAASRAVIAGDLPAIRELVESGRTGMLVPADDVAALAAALARLAANPALRAGLGAAARAHVAKEFSDTVNLDRLEAAFARAAA